MDTGTELAPPTASEAAPWRALLAAKMAATPDRFANAMPLWFTNTLLVSVERHAIAEASIDAPVAPFKTALS